MKKVKTFTFDPTITRPVTLRHVADEDLIFKSETENFNFGLQLKSYNVLKNLKDRKSNYNSAYFLSDLQSLSSILELDTPYEFVNDSRFTTYIKLSSNYIKAENSSSSLSFDSNFNYLDSKYFFTVTLSTNRYLYITKQFGDDTYYAYCSSESIYLSSTVPGLSSHLFEYVLENNNLKLYPYKDLANPLSSYQVIMSNTLQLTSTDAGNTVSSVFDVNRNTLTRHKKKLNNALTFYLSSYNNDGVDINLNTTTNYVSNNYLGFTSIYSLDYCDKKYDGTQTIGFDIIPLKNQATVEEYPVPANHYNSQPDYLNREYEKIQSGYNEEGGYDKIYLSYNTGTKDIHFPPSRLTYFTTPSSLSPYTILNINDSKIDSIGAVASNRPQMADKVYKRRLDIKSNNFTDDINATYLCSWLSGNEAGEKLWVDRYYNPDAVNYSEALSGTAFYNTVTAAGAQSTYMFDISSRLTFETNNDYAYYHIGERDYINHIKSFERYNLAKTIDLQSSKGASISTSKEKEDTVINLDGDTFGKFITDYKGDACCSFWLSANDYSKPFAYKILGNYFEDGFGIFNTDFVTPNLFIPVGNKILLLNTDLEIYDEIELLEGTTPVNIKGIARKDNFSDFYVLGENNVIYVYNSNPNLVSKIDTLSGVSNLLIEDIDVTNNRIYVAFNPTGSKGYYYFDFSTNKEHFTPTVSSETYGDKVKIFANPKNKNVSFLAADSEINTGNELAVDDNNSPFTIRQKSPTARNVPYNLVYKNAFVNNNTNVIEVSGGDNNSVLTNVIVDDEDNIITIHDNNRISKLKNTRELISFKDLTFLSSSSTKYLDVILDFEENVYKKYYLIVEKLSDKTLLHKIDKEFNLVKTKNLGRLINSLELTRSITSFYYLKKYDADKNKLKVLLKTKPKFTQTGTFKKVESKIVFDISQLNPGYNHFAVNINLSQGWMDLYVNGKKFERTAFAAGTYLLDNPFGSGFFIGALSTPYYLTLASRLQLAKKYFVKNLNIKGFRLHKRVLDLYEIRSLVNYHGYNKDSVWSLPVGQRSYVDTIDRVFKFDTPERNTNYFEVDIKNINISNAKFRNDLKAEITKEVNKLIPYYDVLRNIRIDEGIVNEDFDPGTCDVIIEDRIKINVPGEPEKQAVKPEDPTVTKYYCEVTESDGKGGRIRNTPHDPSDPLYGDVCCLLSPYNNVFRFEYRECPPVIITNFHEQCWSENSQEGAVHRVNENTGTGELIHPIRICCKSEADKNETKTRNFTDGNCPTKEDEKDCTPPLQRNNEGICVCPNGGHLPVDGDCTGECINGRTSISDEVCCIDKNGEIQVGESRQHLCEEEEPRPYCDISTSLPGVIVGGDQNGDPCCGMDDNGNILPVTEFGDCGCGKDENGNEIQRDEEGNCVTLQLTPSEYVVVTINLRFDHIINHRSMTSIESDPANAVGWSEKTTGTVYTYNCVDENGDLEEIIDRGWGFCNYWENPSTGVTNNNIEVDFIPEVLTTQVGVYGQIAYTSDELTALYRSQTGGYGIINASVGNAIRGQATTNWNGEDQTKNSAGAGFLEIQLDTTNSLHIKRMLNTIAGLINSEVRFYSVGTYQGKDWLPWLNNWVDTTFFTNHGGTGTTIDTDPTTTENTTLSEIIQSGANAIPDGQYENGARISVDVIAKQVTLENGGIS